MSDIPTSIPFNKRAATVVFALALWLVALTAFGQAPQSNVARELKANQTFEREMTGAETHRYKFDLKADEFFQVRVEQKGVDVTLKLTDASGNVLATMDSPNGKEGFETLTFVAAKAGGFILEAINSDAKVEKGIYTIKRVASRTAAAKDKERVEVERDFVEAMKTLNTDRRTSLGKLEKALAGWQAVGDAEMEKLTLQYVDFQALALTFDKANQLVKESQAKLNEGQEKGSIEILDSSKVEILKADEAFHEAGVLAQKLFNTHPTFVAKNPTLKNYPYFARNGQINVAAHLSNYYQYLLQPAEQLKYAEQAASIAKELPLFETYNVGEAEKLLTIIMTLQHMASAMQANKNPEAISYYEQALAKYREIKKLGSEFYRRDQEAAFLQNIAFTYSVLCQGNASDCKRKEVENYDEAKSIYEELKDYREAATLQYFIASTYQQSDEMFKSFERLEKALSLAQKLEDKELISQILFAKGSLFFHLGNEDKAKEVFKQGLENSLSIPSYIEKIESSSMPPFEKRNRLNKEYARLLGIAGYYQGLSEYSKAISIGKETIAIAKKLEDKSHEAAIWGNIGSAYQAEKDWTNASDYYQQSIILAREVGDKQREVIGLNNAGFIYLELHKPKEALQTLTESQLIISSLGADDIEVANGLAKTWYALGNRRLAVFYGKKLVDWIQNERHKLRDFDQTTQQTFVNSFEKPIRRLAGWLIEEGDFAAAERVLRMLKEEEYSAFVRRDASEIKTLNQRIELDDNEKKLIERYKLLADKVSEKGQRFYELEQKSIRLSEKGLTLSAVSPEEEKEYQRLGGELKDARDAFQTFLNKELVKEIGEARKEKVEGQQADRQILGALGKGTVMLYTVVGEDRYRVILTAPSVQVDGKSEIKASELNAKVYAFRAALKNPKADPRPLGKALYDILIKPIEKDLKASGAKTLLWYLDGTLRYIPLAALSPDGKRYFGGDYQNVVLTSKTSDLQSQVSGRNWKVLGLGVSVAETVDNPIDPQSKMPFSELPGTKRELFTIVSDEGTLNEKGILPGRRFLDENFTVENLQGSLRARKYNIVHLASHFYLGSKDASSFLLLGNNQILTLSEIKGSSFITFGGVDLVTLSACNTAFAGSSNGSEVDSLADIIQSQGGKSVLATLWSVADESTSLLMSEFYRLRKENPQLTKAEALQIAQQEMIAGKLKPSQTTAGRRDTSEADAEPSPDYSHPYYWSPFVLIGNWR